MREISTVIMLIYRKLGLVGSVQKIIKLPSPYTGKYGPQKTHFWHILCSGDLVRNNGMQFVGK